ncbi:MAG: homoserine dehydrogenase [Myxococcales bacterium FL481]|nr:MAG: homoserine dehydrogenase [Myxococcales bacterium FL481]
MRNISIGLLGLGNVGSGTVRILSENRESLARRLEGRVTVKRVLVRDPSKARDVELPMPALTTDPDDILDDPDIRVVVELIGGIEPAREYVLRALTSGKHVVTANKALIAEHGAEIFAEAARRRLSVHFEGAVAGGIPVLRAVREGLASDRITAVTGIVNGTSNFVLDTMTSSNASYTQAVTAAQRAGFAEADPTLDVSGRDAAHKLAILTLLSFGVRIRPDDIATTGIDLVRAFDIAAADQRGYVIKSLAQARLGPDGRLHAYVTPALVPKQHIFAGVHGAYNAVLVESAGLGHSMYYGPGAGMMPTGTAVVSDIIEVCRDVLGFVRRSTPPEAFHGVQPATPAPLGGLEHQSYLCFHVPNVPGILGRVASTLGAHGVSIDSMDQDTPGDRELLEMVIVTERVSRARLDAALREIDAFDVTAAPTHHMPIVDPM